MAKLRAPVSTAFAMLAGIVLLISLIAPGLEGLRASILSWAILLAAIALLLGLANLFQVHVHKIINNQKVLYSYVLLTGMLLSFAVTLVQGREGLIAEWLFNYVLFPLESSFMAILAILLTLAVVHLIQQRNDIAALLFSGTLLLVLLGSAPIFAQELPLFSESITPFISRVLSLGALRGLLIGVALGTLTTGLRVLMGAERPFGG